MHFGQSALPVLTTLETILRILYPDMIYRGGKFAQVVPVGMSTAPGPLLETRYNINPIQSMSNAGFSLS